jgi:hypothetical protein
LKKQNDLSGATLVAAPTTRLALGDLAAADLAAADLAAADLAAAEQTAGELRQIHYDWQLPLARATRALLAGRFADAEEQAAHGLAIGRRAGDQAVEPYHLAASRSCGSCRAAQAKRSSRSRTRRPASRDCRSGSPLPPRWPMPAGPARRRRRSSGWPPGTWPR